MGFLKMESKVKKLFDEFKIVGIAFVLMYLFFQIHYYKESPLTLIETAFAHFYLFIIPGYSLCLLFYKKINKIERLIIGTGLGYGLQPFILYLINYFVKVNIMNYNIYVSTALTAIGILIFNSQD